MRSRLPRRKLPCFIFIALTAIALIVVGVLAWLSVPLVTVMEEAESAIVADAAVRVTRERWLAFEPTNQSAEMGLVFYPGGRIPADGYAPLARVLAENGVMVVLVPMPLNLAILDPDAATAVIEANPEVLTWVIGGHSLGGVMAARYAHSHAESVAGLVLLAAYPEDQINLSKRDLAVASIYGDRDGLATVEDVESGFARLPPGTD